MTDQPAAVGARLGQPLAQPRDMHLQAVARPRGRLLTPQLIDQAIDRSPRDRPSAPGPRTAPAAADRPAPPPGHPPAPRPDRATRSETRWSCRPSRTPPRVPRVRRLYARSMAAGWRAVGGRLATPRTVSPMHSPSIALALADARIADRQRAATHRTATTAPRRHRRRALLGLAATVALAAVPPTGARAQPPHDPATASPPRPSLVSPSQIDAADHAAAIRSINLHLARATSPVSPPEQPAPAAVVRITRVGGDGFDWLDASIGAGLTAALLLGAARVASLRRRPSSRSATTV